MIMSIFISGIIIFLCESKGCENIRSLIKEYMTFFDGKKSMIENIFIGILGSSIISLIGFIYEYNVEKRKMYLKIIALFRIIYFRYYKTLGIDDIKDIKEKFLQDESVIEISYCSVEYERFFFMRDDIYKSAIEVMKWLELQYICMFSIHSVAKEIENYVEQVSTRIEEMEEWEMNGLTEKAIEDSKKTLCALEEQYKDVLDEFNNIVNCALESKKEMDNKKVVKIKNEFGIFDDRIAAFWGNRQYVERVWKDIEK